MSSERIRRFCPRCGHQQLFEKSQIHHGLHLFLSIITAGLWLVSWISIVVMHRLRPWRCVHCGWGRTSSVAEKREAVPEKVD